MAAVRLKCFTVSVWLYLYFWHISKVKGHSQTVWRNLDSGLRSLPGQCQQQRRQTGGLQSQVQPSSSGGTGWWGMWWQIGPSAAAVEPLSLFISYFNVSVSQLFSLISLDTGGLWDRFYLSSSSCSSSERLFILVSFRKNRPVCVWAPPPSFWWAGVWITVFTCGTWRPRDCTELSRWDFSQVSILRPAVSAVFVGGQWTRRHRLTT